MKDKRQHFLPFVKACREEEDNLPFLLGYLLKELSDEMMCDALNALSRHRLELLELEQRSADARVEELLNPPS